MRTPRIALVTGATGFIGWPAAAALVAEGTKVIALDLAAPDRPIAGCEIIIGNFIDLAFLHGLFSERQIDTVVHTGGISGPMLARDDPYAICQTNVMGTVNLLEVARLYRVERFVHCGSAHAFGNTPPAPVSDDPPLRATDMYGASKGASDILLRAYRAQTGLDAVSLRISNGYGPRRRTRCAIRIMLENALDGTATDMEWGKGYGRAYLYVEDAVAAIVAAAKAPIIPQWSYNIAGSDFTMMEDIAGIVRRMLPSATITMREGVDNLGYRREALDISAARRDLGWEPRFRIECGIRSYLDWLVADRRESKVST